VCGSPLRLGCSHETASAGGAARPQVVKARTVGRATEPASARRDRASGGRFLEGARGDALLWGGHPSRTRTGARSGSRLPRNDVLGASWRAASSAPGRDGAWSAGRARTTARRAWTPASRPAPACRQPTARASLATPVPSTRQPGSPAGQSWLPICGLTCCRQLPTGPSHAPAARRPLQCPRAVGRVRPDARLGGDQDF
jgi:hypothetical protein